MLQTVDNKLKKFSYIDYEHGLTTEHTFVSCFEKEFDIVASLTREPLTLDIPELGLKKEYIPILHWQVSMSVFKQYSCLEHPYCKQCCTVKFWKLFLNQPDKGDRVVKVFLKGKEKIYYCDDSNFSEKGCKYLGPEGGCVVHATNPAHCMLPLIFFDKKEAHPESVTIKKRVFGRNHIIGCPVAFKPYKKFEDFEYDTIGRFQRLKSYLEELEIDSHIDDVIAHLYKIGRREIIIRRLV